MAIKHVSGDFFDGTHRADHSAFGFKGSVTPQMAKGGQVHSDAKQDRALITKMLNQHEKSEPVGLARGGNVRLPRGMKPKAAQSHSPIQSPSNTPPRKPQLTRTPTNAMPGGVMPYGTMPSHEAGYDGTSDTGATPAMMKRGGRVRP